MIAALPLWAVFAVFAAAGAVIFLTGTRLSGLADQIADRTGIGEALIGGVLLGAATSLSGSIVSLTAALDGRASLAFSNGVGGIAAQTAFLAVADLTHRRANLEHAAADLANVFQATVLLILLAIPLVAWTAPEAAFWSVHPASLALVVAYGIGLAGSRRIRNEPMWRPVSTRDTREDVPEDPEEARRSPVRPLIAFGAIMGVAAVAGWTIAQAGGAITDALGLSATLVGALMTAVVTSLPELVTTVAAVRRGALSLAVGGIIGGNTFDMLFLTISDLGYREGSIYHAVGPGDYFWIAVAILMTGVLLAGLVLRERQGPGGVGLESVLMLAIYAAAILLQVLSG
jgi:cation:H+ antiporter